MKSVSLYFREGSSDKVYHASIEAQAAGYVVNFAYGRRGTALTTGTKTQHPVDLPSAEKIFNKIVKEKTSKGYTPDESGTPVVVSAVGAEDTGIRCQLLNPVEGDQVNALLEDDNYIAQEKHDGRRLLIKKKETDLFGINRKGLTVSLHPDLASLKDSPIDFIVDGEDMGDGVVYVFDALECNGIDLRGMAFSKRLVKLKEIVDQTPLLIKSIVADNTIEKRKLYERLVAQGKEGIVFKRKDAPYTAGQPNSGGTQLKHKFYETASFIVQQVNDKRSVAIGLYWVNGKIFDAGNVTIPANHEIPVVGDVVEVRYLYAFRESGAVYQPVYLGKREDIDKSECVVSQLKYKSA